MVAAGRIGSLADLLGDISLMSADSAGKLTRFDLAQSFGAGSGMEAWSATYSQVPLIFLATSM